MNPSPNKFLGALLATYFIIIGGLFVGYLHLSQRVDDQSSQSTGSVAVGSEYRNYMASSTSASANTPIVLKTRPGSLGSVTIQTTSAGGIFRLYDSIAATSAPSMVGSFPASAVVGTYTFDIVLNNGLVVEAPTGFNGIYTVTYR